MSEFQTPTPPTSEVTSDDRLWGLLAYLFTPLVPVIILLMEDKKNRPLLKAHYMQALILGVLFVIVGTVLSFIPIVGCIWPFVWLIIVVLYGIKAYRGEYITIPFVTNFVKQQGWA